MKKLIALLFVLTMYLPAQAAPREIHWGPYAVRTHIDRQVSPVGRRVEINILRDGRAVRSMVGNGTPRVRQMTMGNQSLLFVSVGDTGNDGLDLVYAFRYTDGSVQNVLAMPGVLNAISVRQGIGRSHLIDVKDYGIFNEFDHFSRGAIGPVERVYAWRSGRFVDVTSRYPRATLKRAERAKRRLLATLPAIDRYLKNLPAVSQGDSMAESHEDVMVPLIDYWANETAAGHRRSGDRFLRAHSSPALRRWIDEHRAMFGDALRKRSKVMPIDNRRVLGYS